LGDNFSTLGKIMDAAANAFPDHEAYVEGDNRLSFGDWVAQADRLGAELSIMGIGPGDVVAVLLPSSIDYAICYAALVRIGAIMTGLNTRLGPRERVEIIRRAEPRLLIVSDFGDIPETARGIPTLDREMLRQLYTSDQSVRCQVKNCDPRDPVSIVWTSGTTGLPKGAWFDHRALAAAVPLAGIMTAAFDRRLVATPFAHAGYMSKLWEQFAFAVTNIISPTPWRADETLRIAIKERISVLPAVPTQWEKLLALDKLNAGQLPYLRLCVTATAPASSDLIRRIESTMERPVIVRYAMTESPTITGTLPGDSDDVRAHTVGRPQLGVEVSVRDTDGHSVPPGSVGNVHIRSPAMMRGYWRDPDATRTAISDSNWLRSGDLGLMDEAGNLRLCGRNSDMYIRGGYNVYPSEIEAVLREHPDVSEVAVIGVPASVIGESGTAFVVLRDATKASPRQALELALWCRQNIADYKVPSHVEFIDSVPLTPMLKVDRRSLIERAKSLPTRTIALGDPK
jgi:acyl-CoA synthetase (AMP-forming)/AMP-acid ligase II